MLSVWAFIHQRRQTLPRLEVLISPIWWATIDGKSVLGEDWPGLVVRNQSTFPLRVFNVGFRIGRKFYSFGRPAVGGDSALTPAKQWPLELAPRSRTAFYLDGVQVSFGDSIKPALKGRRIWEVARACGREMARGRKKPPMIHRYGSEISRKMVPFGMGIGETKGIATALRRHHS